MGEIKTEKRYKQIMSEADKIYDNLKWHEKLFVPRGLFTASYYIKLKEKDGRKMEKRLEKVVEYDNMFDFSILVPIGILFANTIIFFYEPILNLMLFFLDGFIVNYLIQQLLQIKRKVYWKKII